MRIGTIELPNRLFVAPMAGVTDRPFRQLCKRLGAGYAVSEMVTSRPDLQKSLKTSRRAKRWSLRSSPSGMARSGSRRRTSSITAERPTSEAMASVTSRARRAQANSSRAR